MTLTGEARETARFLAEALEGNKIERRFSFLVIRERGRSSHTKPQDGVLDSSFRVPISKIPSLIELTDLGLISASEERVSNSGHRWEVWLKNEFLEYVARVLRNNESITE